MNIAIVGTGYVGLVTGTCFAEMGAHVICIDTDTEKIDLLKNGEIPHYEPGLKNMVQRNVNQGRLVFTTNILDHLNKVEIFFIAVGTPSLPDGSADLSAVWNVVDEIASYMTRPLLLVTKSTVPVGTTEQIKRRVQDILKKRTIDIPFDVASNPEFLKEGSAIRDFMSPDRVIVGTDSERAAELLQRLYNPFMLNNNRLILMNTASAEMTKYVSNAMLAARISLMNEVSLLCDATGADINMVREGVGSDTRIGSKFLYPGCGYGGSCFPKDIRALCRKAEEHGCRMEILEMIERVNQNQKNVLFQKVVKARQALPPGEEKAPIETLVCLWGLAFKPETNDIREAPSLALIDKLLQHGYRIQVYDPEAMHEVRKLRGDSLVYAKNKYAAVKGADILILVTEWKEFRLPQWQQVRELMSGNVLIDGRNLYSRKEMEKEGFLYWGIGC